MCLIAVAAIKLMQVFISEHATYFLFFVCFFAVIASITFFVI